MHMRAKILLLLAMTVFMLTAACSGPAQIGETPLAAECNTLIDTKCTKCHYKTRICNVLGTKSVGKWHRTIKFMIRQGAQLTDDERNKVVACLATMPRNSDIVCK